MPSFDSERSGRRVEIRSEECCALPSEVTSVKSLLLPTSQTLQVPVRASPVELYEVPLLHQPARVISHRFTNAAPLTPEASVSEARSFYKFR